MVRHALGVVIGFSLLFAALFSPVLFSGRLLGTTDAVIYYYPAFAAHSFSWTTLLYSGYPVQGDPQAMFWYPLAWLARGLPTGPPIAWNLFIVSAYVLSASFAYGYAHRVTSSKFAAAIAGISYGMSGFAIAHLDHASILHTLVWVPLVLFALEAQRDSRSWFWFGVSALAVANATLAGHPQLFVYAMLLAGAYAVVRARGARDGATAYLLRTALAAACGVGLAAVMWVPMLELASFSLRGAMTRADFFQYALEWAQLPQLLLPHVFGGALGAPGASPGLPYFGPGISGEVTGSTGLVPVLLAGVACFAAFGAREVTLVRFFVGVAVVSVLLSLGDNAFVSEPLFHLPGYNRFRIPARHLFELSLALAVLAALGVTALERLAPSRRVRVTGVAVALAGVVLLGAVASVAVTNWQGVFVEEMYRAGVVAAEALPWRNSAVLVQGAAFAFAVSMLVLWARASASRPKKLASIALVLGIALDLSSYAFFSGWRMSADPEESFAMPPSLSALQTELATTLQRVAPLTFDAPATALPPNRNLLWQIPSALGYGPLPLADYASLLGLSAAHFRSPEDLARVLGPNDRGLDVLATRYVLVPDDTEVSDTRARRARYLRPTREGTPQWQSVRDFLDASSRFERRPGLPGTAVYENKRAAPRAWLVGRLEVADRDASLRALHTGRLAAGERFDPMFVALVEERPSLEPTCGRSCGEVEIVRIEDREVVVRTRATRSSFLVSSDVYYPGWRAFLDGGPETEIYRTNVCLRGVAIPAGEHEVRFVFRSTSMRLGSLVSLASAILLAALLALHRSGQD